MPLHLTLVLAPLEPPTHKEAKVPLGPAARVNGVDPPGGFPPHLVEPRLDAVTVVRRRVAARTVERGVYPVKPFGRELVDTDARDALGQGGVDGGGGGVEGGVDGG